MMLRRLAFSMAALFIASICASAQQPVVKHVPIRAVSPASGQQMYTAYCAACHGKDAKGNGPAAEALKTPPPDLTLLSKNNGGKYPSLRVGAILRGDTVLTAHGSKDMPIWGKLFWAISKGHSSEVDQRVANLNKYLESLQEK